MAMKSRFFPVVLTAALTSLGTLFVAARFNKTIPFIGAAPQSQQLPVSYAGTGSTTVNAAPPIDFQRAAEGSVKAVVHIKTTTKSRTVTQDQPYMDMFGNIFGQRQQYYIPQQMGSGSGVVVSPDGYIVTNNHVVANADIVTVTFNDRNTMTAKVIGKDPSTDIAVLKVEANGLPFMEFGNSDDVKLGQWVLAVGYPLTLDATVTAGIVSAKSRSIGINRTQSKTAIESFIQTDAAVNPGNSGGALVNTNGQLVGINAAIASPTGSYAGYSYAIPANIARKVVNDMMQYGSVQRGYLGIEPVDLRSLTDDQLAKLGIKEKSGIYVYGVSANGGAAKAGIQKGDFIREINGVLISTQPELLEQVARYKPGDNVSVTYVRNGAERIASVELKNLDGNTSVIKENNRTLALGATFKSMSSNELAKYGVRSGVMVTDLGNGLLAKKTNMKKGFIITNVNDEPVTDVDDLQQKMAANGNKVQLAGFYPDQRGMFYYGLSDTESTASME